MKYTISNVEKLPSVAKEILNLIQSDSEEAKIVVFDAEMGAGKTTLMLFILKEMGIENPGGSPTYSLVNVYESEIFGRIYHLDLYRLNSLQEAYDIGIEDIIYDNAYVFIEWADKIETILPDNCLKIKINVLSDEENQRVITVEN